MDRQSQQCPSPLRKTELDDRLPEDAEQSAPARDFLDAGLLFRCMDMLSIDRRRMAAEDPLLFYELQGICSLCLSKQQCAQQLADGLDVPRWDKWWGFCPNALTLATIGAVQNRGCTQAKPHSND